MTKDESNSSNTRVWLLVIQLMCWLNVFNDFDDIQCLAGAINPHAGQCHRHYDSVQLENDRAEDRDVVVGSVNLI